MFLRLTPLQHSDTSGAFACRLPALPAEPALACAGAVRAALPRAARTRLRKPGSASLAAASSSLYTAGISLHEPQQSCQHALMTLQPMHITSDEKLLRHLLGISIAWTRVNSAQSSPYLLLHMSRALKASRLVTSGQISWITDICMAGK